MVAKPPTLLEQMRRLDTMLEKDIDIVDRAIYLISDIDSASAETVIKGVDFFSSISDDPITIHLSTYGGDPYMGFAIYDTLRKCKCPIVTVTTGACMSAGVLIAAAGDKGRRYADPNTSWMYHSGSEGFEGETNNFIATAEHTKLFKEICIDAIKSRSKKSRKFWAGLENKSSDTYFKSTDALKWGIIDKITEAY
jgi:ATP-dependent Clp protease protease subunit